MHVGRRYDIFQTLRWSQTAIIYPLAWATVVTCLYELLDCKWLSVPWLPLSAMAVAVAFYLGFKNNASYDRMWEARKIWGAIVNASRSWAYSSRDLVSDRYEGHGSERVSTEALKAHHTALVHRHVAWMDALRHQLRKVKSWEHQGAYYDRMRKLGGVPEHNESLEAVLAPHLAADEMADVLAQINPAAHLLARQSAHLAELRSERLLDGFSHTHLQGLLNELMTQQGKAERIKNFPFPRQYATVNHFFATLFCGLVPMGMLETFNALPGRLIWGAIPASVMVCWVFLTTDRIGDWSENPFEGLANDVPITSMARGIERDIKQIIGETDLPPNREMKGQIQY